MIVVVVAVLVAAGGGGNEVPTLHGDIMNRMVWWADGGLETSSSDVDVPAMKEQHAIVRRELAIFIIIECFCCR